MMMCRSALTTAFTAAFIAFAIKIHPSFAAVSVKVASGAEECFSIQTPSNSEARINGNFDCLDDDLSPEEVTVSLYDENFNVVWSSEMGEPEGKFSVTGHGRYQFCIQNGDDGGDDMDPDGDGFPRNVGFSLRVVPFKHGRKEIGPDDKVTSEVMELSMDLIENLSSMLDHQAFLRSRELIHVDLADQTYRKVVNWSIVEALVLGVVSGGQVLYLRRFFEQRRFL